jgi:hypothetical protein
MPSRQAIVDALSAAGLDTRGFNCDAAAADAVSERAAGKASRY